MKKYQVKVQRLEFAYIDVEADDKEAAVDAALDEVVVGYENQCWETDTIEALSVDEVEL